MQLNIQPRVVMVLGAIVTSLAGIGTIATSLTTVFGSGEANKLVAGGSILAFFLGPIIIAIGGGASSTPGPLAPQDPDVVVQATKLAATEPGTPAAAVAAQKTIAAAEAH